MPAFNQSRSRIIQIIFLAVFIIIAAQLVHLQVFSSKYKMAAESNAIFRKVIYPDRGIIFDRKRKALLQNNISFDLVVTPSETKGIDTFALCNLLGIDTSDYRKRMKEIIFKNTAVRPSIFEALLSDEMYAKLNENMYKFPGFILNERKARTYPYNIGANILGYIGEVDTTFLRKHKNEGYEMNDYTGMTGLERTYEKVLMGERGVKRYIKDNKSRIQGSYENGMYDTSAVAGKNLYTSIDVELQALAERLMKNKVGAIVAINPKTGGILCMVSAPTYNPNYLTGSDRKKHFAELLLDPRLPFNNRPLGNMYSPGSTFKTVSGIIGLTEGVIDERTTITCPGFFTGCGTGKPKCLDKGTFNFTNAVAHSDNTYFSTVFKRLLEQPRYGGADSALTVFNTYASSFGLGAKLGVDLPSEKKGNLPTSAYYRKKNGGKFYACNLISNAIGQGEVQTTLVQLANVMTIIANRGWYYTPHVVDSIEGGDEYKMLDAYKIKHHTDKRIPDSVYTAVQDGMQAVVDYGTAAGRSKIPGIVMCGKTGTVENSDHGVQQKDHSFFGAFAPRDNPKIAIAVMCENAGQGAWFAAPIASLLVEKYLRDSIAGTERNAQLTQLENTNLIPQKMRLAMAKRDSLKQIRESQKLQEKINKENIDSTEEEEISPEIKNTPSKEKTNPAKDSSHKKKTNTIVAAFLNNEKKKKHNIV
ncbi:MAG: penicillin-binding protein 2 [Bacteroidetes bacterium]|nr:penicillin-binding protein 2 [Bacteroidota bacterium]MBS1591842.1 penicillin-binding protein 2 [Bacteroidota bacterium]